MTKPVLSASWYVTQACHKMSELTNVGGPAYMLRRHHAWLLLKSVHVVAVLAKVSS